MFSGQERWGRNPAEVVRASRATFNMPLLLKEPSKIFTCSWSDFFISDADLWRDEAWDIMRRTPHTYQVLTKRPQMIRKKGVYDRLPADWGDGYPNVWLGVSVENNDVVWRVDELRKIPARVRFISYEPALGPLPDLNLDGIHWLIYGGESGHGRRPDKDEWAQEIAAKCEAAGVAFFFKQASAARPGYVPDEWFGRQEFPAP